MNHFRNDLTLIHTGQKAHNSRNNYNNLSQIAEGITYST